MAFGKACITVLVIGLIGAAAPANAQVDLLEAADGILGGAVGTVRAGLTSLVTGLFGPQNTFLTQIPENIKTLSWGSLQNLGIDTPISSFIGSIQNVQLPTDVLTASDKLTDFIDGFCQAEECKLGPKIPSNCIGKALNVRFAPWECSLYKNGTVACNPPFIEILTAPASCSLKYQKAGTFIGKECKLAKDIGQEVNVTLGGEAFSVSINKNLLDIPKAIATSLLPNKFDKSPTEVALPSLTSALDATTKAAGDITSAIGGSLSSAASAVTSAAASTVNSATTGLAGR